MTYKELTQIIENGEKKVEATTDKIEKEKLKKEVAKYAQVMKIQFMVLLV